MGNRRLGRKRLYGIEKEGQEIDLGAGVGIKDTIARTTQHRLGQELITEIVVDLGAAASAGLILGGGGDTQVVGKSGAASQLGRLSRDKVGVVTEIRAVMTEVPAGGNTVLDLEMSAAIVNQGGSPGTTVVDTLNAIGVDASYTNDADVAGGTGGAGMYLYICNGSGSSSAAMTAGKLTIYIYGFAVPDDL
tara:strand:- start:3809 stop:4381 length:573 start_codon:yes stop_codon:yes gene_type:complete